MVGTGATAAETVGCCLPAVKSLTQLPSIQLHSDVSLEYVSLYKLNIHKYYVQAQILCNHLV